ncbi:MAG TPA: DUF4160 domain-containing protein [Longimicrobiales bacterium]|nr:DUF4160 domain-containing protein [Longimicrobiales bacterium]
MSPTIHRESGFRFSFYSREGQEPPHVHVEKGGGYGKLWLTSEKGIAWAYAHGFTGKQMRRIEEIVARQRDGFLKAWHDHFHVPPPGAEG